MSRSSVIVLKEMLESIDKITKYIAGMSSIDFVASSAVQDAVLHRLMIIGEATKQIPENLRQQYPEIAWRQIAGLRDIVAHEYFRVDLAMVWTLV